MEEFSLPLYPGKEPTVYRRYHHRLHCRILGKLVSGQINYVLLLYCFNLVMVSIDLGLYFRNKRSETGVLKVRKA